MASLKAIRAAVKTTLEANLADMTGYATIPGATNLPAFVVDPVDADFNVAMGRGTDTYQFDLAVMVNSSDLAIGQDELDDYLTGAGAKSIRAVVFANRTLGLTDTDAHVAGMSGYSTQFETSALEHIGAVLRLVVTTKGTE